MEDLIIQIGASSKQFQEELEKAQAKTEDFSSAMESIAVKTGLAFAALTAAIGFSVAAYAEQEQVALRTNAALIATGGVSGMTAESIRELGEALAKQTTFSKEAVEQGENVLLTFTNIGQNIFPAATEATLDLAARMGGDAAGAAQMLGRALQDPTAGLQRLSREGIIFTEGQKAQIEIMQKSGDIAGAQALILKNLESSIGGFAAASAQGTGTFKQLANVMEDLWQNIGEQFAPILISAAGYLRDFLQTVADNKELVIALAAGLAGLTAAFGAVFAAATGGIIIAQLSAALAALGVAAGAAQIALIGLAGATGIGLVVVAGAELYAHWADWWPSMQAAFQSFVVNVRDLASGLGSILKGIFTLNSSDISAGLTQLTETLSVGFKKVYDETLAKVKPEAVDFAKDLADVVADIQTDENAKRITTIKAQDAAFKSYQLQAEQANNAAMMLQALGASNDLITLKKNEAQILAKLGDAKFQGDRLILKAALADLAAQYEAANATELARTVTFHGVLTKESKAFHAMSAADQRLFLATHQRALLDSLETEKSAQAKAAEDQLKAEITFQNTVLEKQAKFGADYAALWKMTHSIIQDNTQSAFNNLENLTQSHNDVIKSIGKAAAVANIIIKTREAALNIFEGFSTIPIVGYALGIAGAAAAIAYGVEQTATVLAAADGGLVTGGIPGRDSVPSLLMPGELVVPSKNFNEVVSSVAQARSGGVSDSSGGVNVVISLSRDASQFLTAKQNEDKALGISRARS